MQNWDIEKTKDFILNQFGQSQLDYIVPCLDSLANRQVYASYHFHEYKKILQEHIEPHTSGENILNLIKLAFSDDTFSINGVLPRIGANIVACLQSLHCLMDTLSHVVCYAAGLNLNEETPLTEQKITTPNVLTALNKKTNFSKLHEQLINITLNQEFLYLSALVNHSKHRSIIKPDLHVDLRDDNKKPYNIVFPEFTYKTIKYNSRTVESFLEPFYGWFSPNIIICGNILNEILAQNKT